MSKTSQSKAPESEDEAHSAPGLRQLIHLIVDALAARLPARFFPFRKQLLGEVLVNERIIAPHQLDKALANQGKFDRRLGEMVVDMGFASEPEVLDTINRTYRISAGSLEDDIARMIESRLAFRETLSKMRMMFRFKVSLALVGMIWISIFSISMLMLWRQSAQMRDAAIQMGVASLAITEENAKSALGNNDISTLNRQFQSTPPNKGLLYGIIADPQGLVKVHTNPQRVGSRSIPQPEGAEEKRTGDVDYFVYKDPEKGEVLHLSKALIQGNQNMGRIHLGVSLDFLNDQLANDGYLIVLLSLLIVAFGVILSINLGSSFLRPLSGLLASAQGEDKQIHRYQVKVRPDHEFEDLATSFDSISRKLSQKLLMEKSFGRYVNPAILDKIMANPDEPWLKGTRTDATILFTDVRGFTGMFEKNQPEIIVEALNEYFEICARIIKKYEGYVDKFIGDAVLGVFGAPSPLDYHPLKAVNAALEIQKELKRRARINTNPLLDKIGIGINTGMVVSGNIGSEEKMEYAVIGDSVNMASRISDLAAAGEIVVSSSVIEEIPPNLITVSEMPPQHVKGKKDAITIFKVIKTTF